MFIVFFSLFGNVNAEDYESKLKPILIETKDIDLKIVRIIVDQKYAPDKNNKWCYSELFEIQNEILGSLSHYVYYMTVADKIRNEEDKNTVVKGSEYFKDYVMNNIKNAQKDKNPKLKTNCFDDEFHKILKEANSNWMQIIIQME
jgi:hypothetical protein